MKEKLLGSGLLLLFFASFALAQYIGGGPYPTGGGGSNYTQPTNMTAGTFTGTNGVGVALTNSQMIGVSSTIPTFALDPTNGFQGRIDLATNSAGQSPVFGVGGSSNILDIGFIADARNVMVNTNFNQTNANGTFGVAAPATFTNTLTVQGTGGSLLQGDANNTNGIRIAPSSGGATLTVSNGQSTVLICAQLGTNSQFIVGQPTDLTMGTNKVNVQSANYTITTNDCMVMMSGNHTVTLPAANTAKISGKIFVIMCTSSGTNGILRTGSDTFTGPLNISGATTWTNSVVGRSTWLTSDGSSIWYVLKTDN